MQTFVCSSLHTHIMFAFHIHTRTYTYNRHTVMYPLHTLYRHDVCSFFWHTKCFSHTVYILNYFRQAVLSAHFIHCRHIVWSLDALYALMHIISLQTSHSHVQCIYAHHMLYWHILCSSNEAQIISELYI